MNYIDGERKVRGTGYKPVVPHFPTLLTFCIGIVYGLFAFQVLILSCCTRKLEEFEGSE